jgi:hypothetical protein
MEKLQFDTRKCFDKVEPIFDKKSFPDEYFQCIKKNLVLANARARVARFFLVPKRGKIYQICDHKIYQFATKHTKWPRNIPNGLKLGQMGIKYQHIPLQVPPKIYPNLDFWLENMPSGNPGESTKIIHFPKKYFLVLSGTTT